MFALLFFFTAPRAHLPDPQKRAGEEQAGARPACRRGNAAGVPASGGRRGPAAPLRPGGWVKPQKIKINTRATLRVAERRAEGDAFWGAGGGAGLALAAGDGARLQPRGCPRTPLPLSPRPRIFRAAQAAPGRNAAPRRAAGRGRPGAAQAGPARSSRPAAPAARPAEGRGGAAAYR